MYPNSIMYLSGIFVHCQVKELAKSLDVKVIAPIPYVPFFLSRLSKNWRKIKKISYFEKIDSVEIFHTKYLAIPNGLFKNFWGYFFALFSMWTVWKLNKIKKIDMIHAHGSTPNDFGAFLISKLFRVPLVITVHGETVYSIQKYPKRYRNSIKAIIKANAVITVSKVMKKKIFELSGKDGVNIIYNGYEEKALLSFNSPKNESIQILFAATLYERKGLRYLLEAASIILKKYLHIEFIIAGGGPQLDEMKDLSRILNIKRKVTFCGEVSHERMMHLMNICDIFVLPSWDEAFGVVYFEAMSFKKPVIGTEGEGVSDFIQDGMNGFLVKPKNVSSIIDKLIPLIESEKLREEIGLKGYKTIKNLTWENSAKEVIKVYTKVLETYHA